MFLNVIFLLMAATAGFYLGSEMAYRRFKRDLTKLKKDALERDQEVRRLIESTCASGVSYEPMHERFKPVSNKGYEQ